jgi:hypothetical protein
MPRDPSVFGDAEHREVIRPAWHRRASICGVMLIGAALVAMVTSFPFIAGDPRPGHPADQRDPTWFPIVGWIVVAFLFVGITLLVAPLISKRIARRGAR